jgi:hypothetical protein
MRLNVLRSVTVELALAGKCDTGLMKKVFTLPKFLLGIQRFLNNPL